MSIHLVKEFHDKFSLPAEDTPRFPCEEDMNFRVKRQAEECEELWEAYLEHDIVGGFDALLDAVYIAVGTALRFGITPEQWDKGFAAVHAANMRKVRATHEGESKYKTTVDIVKPKDWTGPEEHLARILGV